MLSNCLSVQARDGTVLRLRQYGSVTTKCACLLIHGFGDAEHVWAPLVKSLASQLAVITVDLRGHGDSERARSGSYSLASHVEDVAGAIRQLGLGQLIIVGHSLGGKIGICLAAKAQPHEVVGLVLVDSSPDTSQECIDRITNDLEESLRGYSSIEEYATWLMDTRPIMSEATAMALAAGALRRCEHGFFPKFDPVCLRYERVVEKHRRSAADWHRLLLRVACPTLLIRGSGSAVLSAASAAEMARFLTNGRLVTIPMAGHAVMNDNPEAFNSEVTKFVRGIVNSS